MKLRLSILLLAAAALAAAPASGQTIKSLGYNTTNGNIVAATNVTFTNSVGFATNARATTRTNLGLGGGNTVTFSNLSLSGNGSLAIGGMNLTAPDSGIDLRFSRTGSTELELKTNGLVLHVGSYSFSGGNSNGASTTRTNLGLGATWLTNTSVTNFRTAIGLGTTNTVAFDTIQIQSDIFTPALEASDGTNYVVLTASEISFQGVAGPQTRTNLGLGATNNVTFSNITASGTLTATGNATLNGSGNLAPSQTADSASSLMTRGLSDARLSPMPMTPQIIPWFYNGSLSVARVTNGSATLNAIAAFPQVTTTTNAADSGAMIMTFEVWGSLDAANNAWNAIGRSAIIQGRLGATASNAVARFVWSSSTNWPTLMTNVGSISNLGWAVETRNNGTNEIRLIVNGATNITVSDWTPIGFNPQNDSSFMVVPRSGLTSLYFAATGEPFSRTPLITVTNQIGGSVAAAATGGLGFAVVNTNTTAGSSSIYIRRCYQVLGMTNYGY